MKFDDNGVYITTKSFGERFIPWCVYKKVEEGVNNLKNNPDAFPKPIKWLIKRITKDMDPTVHTELALAGLINSVEEIGGRIVWEVD